MLFNTRIFILFLIICSQALAMIDVNFDHSNGLDLLKGYSAKYIDPDAPKELNLLRENYERLKPSKVIANNAPIIPKVIHIIWLGSDPLPQNYVYYIQTWRDFHPNWEVKIWSKDLIMKERFPDMDLFLQARSHAEQADIIRYEILRRYGGLYIDADIECFTNFDELHYKYDFYVNMEPPALNKKRVTIANNMIAAVPNHYILTQTLNNIREHWVENEKYFEDNFSNSWTSFGRSPHNLAVQRTMYPLSDAVFNFLETQDQSQYKSIILPAGYNIPMYVVNNRPIINFLSNTFRGRAKLSNKIELRPETMSFHYYDKQKSLMNEVDFSTSIFKNKKVRGFFYKLLQFRDKYYLAFRDLFIKNFPTKIEYKANPIIPKIIYLESDTCLPRDLAYLQQKWQSMNPDFEIKLVTSEFLQNYIPQNLKTMKTDALELIGVFHLLEKEGGVFVKSNLEPLNLKEFNYKYSFYGVFHNLNKVFGKLHLNTNLIAFIPEHTMLHHIIENIDNELSESSEIDKSHIKKIYLDNAYKFYQLDGKSIIFTEGLLNQKR